MKKIFIFTACAMLYAANAMSQTAGKDNVYIINGEKITNFDGSQLKGKTVTEYRIMDAEKDGKHTIVHTIDVSDSAPADVTGLKGRVLEIRGAENGTAKDDEKGRTYNMDKMLVFVDGNVFKGDLSDISPDEIASIDVYKPGSDKAKHFGESGKNGVIYVYKKETDKDFIYFVNGSRVLKPDFKKLPANKIKSMDIYKAGSKKAIETAGEEGKTRSVLYFKMKE